MEKLTAYNKKGSCSKEETLTTNSISKTPVDPAQQDGNDNSTSSWEEQVSLENEIGFSKESVNQNNKLDTSDHETRNEKLNNKEDSVLTTTKCVNPYKASLTNSSLSKVNKSKETPNRPWTSLFAKVKRGQSTFSSFSPRNNIKSRNDNALILDIKYLTGSLNKFMVSLHETAGSDIIAAKPHINKGARTHLELVFSSNEKLKRYASEGIQIFNRIYFGYIPSDARRSFLPIKIRNVPLGDKNLISEEIKKAFDNIGKIASIKPLLIEGTPYLTDQWIITFETTDDTELEERIPRFYILMDNKITTEW